MLNCHPYGNKTDNTSHCSLRKLVGTEIKLLDFIVCLMHSDGETTFSLELLAAKIKAHSARLSPNQTETQGWIKNLIFKQFPNPQLDWVREILSNATDASTRAGMTTAPVHIKMTDTCITIADRGDGIEIANFFIPGRSANPKTLFNAQAGIEQVTGRFGQGALSIFSYLDALDKREQASLTLHSVAGSLVLSFVCMLDGQQQQITISQPYIAADEFFEVKVQTIPAMPKSTVTIHTKRQESSLKMKFQCQAGELFLDILNTPKKKVGTTIKMTSPKIAENRCKLSEYIVKVFKSCTYPMLLNGAFINEVNVPRLPFVGGWMTFSPQIGVEGGLLRICECGKLIVDFELQKGILVPAEVTIDFKRLVLSQERSSLDFQSPQTLWEAKELVNSIVLNKDLTEKQYCALLNALKPVSHAKAFDLTAQITAALTPQIRGAVVSPAKSPALAVHDAPMQGPKVIGPLSENPLKAPEDVNQELTSTTHFKPIDPSYFCPANFSPFKCAATWRLYACHMPENEPVAAIKKDHTLHLFVSQALLIDVEAWVLNYNLLLLNYWLENNDYAERIDASLAWHQPTAIATEIKGAPLPLNAQFADINWDKYAPPMQLPKGLENELSYFLEWFPQYIYPEDVNLQNGIRGAFLQQEAVPLACKKSYDIDERQVQQYIHSVRGQQDVYCINKLTGPLSCAHHPSLMRYLCDAFFSKQPQFAKIAAINSKAFYEAIDHIANVRVDAKTLHQAICRIQHFLDMNPEQEHELILNELVANGLGFSKKHILENIEDFFSKYSLKAQLIALCGCDDNRAKRIFVSRRDLPEKDMEALKLLARRIDGVENAAIFLCIILNLQCHSFLLSLPQGHFNQFIAMFQLIAVEVRDLKMQDYMQIYRLSLLTEIPKNTLLKWVKVYFLLISSGNFDDAGLLPALIDLYQKENTLTDEGLDALIDALHDFRSACGSLTRAFRYIGEAFAEYATAQPPGSPQAFLEHFLSTNKYAEGWLKRLAPLSPIEAIDLIVHFHNLTNDSSAQGCQDLLKFKRDLYERYNLLNKHIRPFVYALTSQECGPVMSENYLWQVPWDSSQKLLHEDDDLIAKFGSAELAKSRIQGAMQQTLQDYFFVKELTKNGIEAGASKIAFEVHATAENESIVMVQDNGHGMDMDGLKALKVPHSSTKDQAGEDPNFGWGFFTVFRDFDEVIVTTSKDGIAAFKLCLKKTANGLIRQFARANIPHDIGTSIVMKASANPQLSRVKLEAELMSCCRYLKGVEFLFQGSPLHMPTSNQIYHEMKLGDICLQLGQGEEGIYCKGLLMGPLSREHTAFLPPPLKNFLKQEGLKLRLLLPHAKQVLNRNCLIADEHSLPEIQLGIFKMLCSHMVRQWTAAVPAASSLELFSNDYWNNFEFHHSELTTVGLRLRDALHGKGNRDAKIETSLALIAHAKAYLNEQKLKGSHVQEGIIDELESFSLKQQQLSRLQRERKLLKIIEQELLQVDTFAAWLAHYPIDETGLTFMHVRHHFKKLLQARGIMLAQGDYNQKFILSQSQQQLNEAVCEAAKDALHTHGTNSTILLHKMRDAILERLNDIRSQSKCVQSLAIMHLDWHEKVLSKFFTDLTLMLGHNVKVVFYTAADGRSAYILRGFSTIYVNRSGLVLAFSRLCPAQSSFDAHDQKVVALTCRMIKTIAHELVHVEEGIACQSTHDKRFRNNLAKKLELLFITSNTAMSPMQLLLNACSHATTTPPIIPD